MKTELTSEEKYVARLKQDWVKFVNDYIDEGYTPFHLCITYTSPKYKNINSKLAFRLFKNIYTSYLLKAIVGNNFNRKYGRSISPIVVAFNEAHESVVEKGRPGDKFSDREHTHAVLLIHPATMERFKNLVGVNTLRNKRTYKKKIKTSFIAERPSGIIYYIMKNHRIGNEYLIINPQAKD